MDERMKKHLETLGTYVSAARELLGRVEALSSDLEYKYGEKTLGTSVDKIAALGEKKRDFLVYVNTMAPHLLREMGVDAYPLETAIRDGNEIAVLSELSHIESKIGETGVVASILQSPNEKELRIKISEKGNFLVNFLAESTFFFKNIKSMTKEIEARISDLYGPTELSQISEKINFITAEGSVQLYDGGGDKNNAVEETMKKDLAAILVAAEHSVREFLKRDNTDPVSLKNIPSLLDTAENRENGYLSEEAQLGRTI